MSDELSEITSEFREFMKELEKYLNDKEGYWTLRGFIDVARNVYSISSDTKLISKALEIMIIPAIKEFFSEREFKVVLSPEQNFYPDVSLVRGDTKIAVDIKTSYRLPSAPTEISGFTLGAFTGYFRDRSSKKNVVYPYGEYIKHFVLGIIYTDIFKNKKEEEKLDLERQQRWLTPQITNLNKLEELMPPIREIELIFHEKWRLASDSPGSGNTKNIGSIKNIEKIKKGEGIFTIFGDKGEEIFDDYWMYYLTRDMARKAQLPKPPYRNLREYLEYRGMKDLIEKLEGYK